MHRRHLLIGALGLSAAAGLAACRPAGGGQPVLKIGSQKGGTRALMLASGALDGAPFRVEWSEFAAAQPLLEAIGAGAVDAGAVGDAPFLFAYASGAKIRAVQAARSAGGGASTAIIVRKESPLHVTAELRGQRIATGRGSVGHYLLLRVLDREGLSARDAEVVFLAPADAKAAFASGAIDAWATWNPYVALAQLRDGARVLADGRGVMSGYGFQAAGLKAIAEKRDILTAFLSRLAAAQRWGGANPAAFAAVFARETGLDPDVAAATIATTRGQPVAIDAALIAEERRVLDRFRAAGALAAAPDLAAAFDPTFNGALAPLPPERKT